MVECPIEMKVIVNCGIKLWYIQVCSYKKYIFNFQQKNPFQNRIQVCKIYQYWDILICWYQSILHI